MKRQSFLRVSALAAGVWLFAACGSGKPPPPVIATQEADLDPPEPEPEPKAEPAVAEDQKQPATELPTEGMKSVGKDTTANAGAPEISLLDAGKEPRKRLRHSFKKGSKQKLSMHGKTRVSGGNMPLPTFSLDGPIEATIVEVNDAGDAKFSYKAGPFKTKAAGGGMLGGMLGGLAGGGAPEKIAGWGWITPQGVIREQHVTEGAKDGDAPVETGDPFPEDAIGTGARWQVQTIIVEKGTRYRQTSNYELLKLDAKSIKTKVQRLQEPLEGSQDPVAESSGELVYKLGQVYPTGKLSLTRDVQVAIPGASQLGLQMSSEITIKGR